MFYTKISKIVLFFKVIKGEFDTLISQLHIE